MMNNISFRTRVLYAKKLYESWGIKKNLKYLLLNIGTIHCQTP